MAESKNEGLGQLFEEEYGASQAGGVRGHLRKLFSATLTPDMLIFSEDEESEYK